MNSKKQISPNWEKYKDSKGEIKGNFSFNEGFPKTPYDINNARFELILRSGERCKAIVDYSRQYMSEGLEWLALTATEVYNINNHIGRQVVVAWKEI